MFKNYLTYQFALSFERACFSLEAPSREKHELMRCARASHDHFTRSLHSKDPAEVSKSLFVAITYLRDCKEILDQLGATEFEILGKYEVLHARLEQLCWEASGKEGGQTRMFA